MVAHEILVSGVDMTGTDYKNPVIKKPVILQMNNEDFPGRFLRDLASPKLPPISSTVVVDTSSQPLYQPVQRLLTLAMVDLRCDSLSYPRIDPTRILSAGLVIRRVSRTGKSGSYIQEYDKLSAWMRDPTGRYAWTPLSPDQEDWDPDPTQRPQLKSGQAGLDSQLAALALTTAYTETTSPAFAAPPATCAAVGRTVVYGVVPTASSDVSDTKPTPPSIKHKDLVQSLPALLRSAKYSSALTTPASPLAIDSRWLSDDFLNSTYPPTVNGTPPVSTPNPEFTWFHGFATALRMLDSVFNAFPNPNGSSTGYPAILNVLNRRKVTIPGENPQAMGDFFQSAKTVLLDNPIANNLSSTTPVPQLQSTLQMPSAWDALTHQDEKDLVAALIASVAASVPTMVAPQGRFQDSTRYYRLRMFFRIKAESPSCPPSLVWSQYSAPFTIAPWHATGIRAYPPIPLPDLNAEFLNSVKPNCSFQVPANLMNAVQGTTLSGLLKGAAGPSGGSGGGGVSLGWICGFNIPLITICAFFVLNIFLILLNIIFFWLPFIKICIPFPEED